MWLTSPGSISASWKYNMFNKEENVLDLPSFDMLWISFRGDPENIFSLIIPYCEVSNGEVRAISHDNISILAKEEMFDIPPDEFKEIIENSLNTCWEEQGFKRKKIIRLSVQPAKTNKVIQIPINT